jgi:hypothetical protein
MLRFLQPETNIVFHDPEIISLRPNSKSMQKKNILAIIGLLAVTLSLKAQITVTNATFPVAGDSLKTASDLTPDGIVITSAGGPFVWDYSSLTADTRDVATFQPASAGVEAASFPGAELVNIAAVGSETYFDVTATTFSVLGVSGSDLAQGLPIEALLVFTPPLAERHAPLTFPNVFTSQSAFGFAISTADIPGDILDSLGVPSGFLDSVRVRLTISRNDFVDAFGTLTIPGGTYDVLREKRTDYSDTRLEIHIPLLGWQDVTELIGIGAFGQDTSITYSYISNTAKEPIAIVTMDSTGLVPVQVDYKDNGIPNAINPVTGATIEVAVSPNPAINEAAFELKNILPGQHTLHMYDMNGQSVMVRALASDREVVSLQTLSAGMYLYTVVDPHGQVIGTGKLIKAAQ